jgi:hypothetical protein
VKPLDVCLELLPIHPPDPSTADLDGRELSGPHKRIDLGDGDAEVIGHVLITLMTAALVVAIWGVARDRLVAIVSTALDSVCGSIGC